LSGVSADAESVFIPVVTGDGGGGRGSGKVDNAVLVSNLLDLQSNGRTGVADQNLDALGLNQFAGRSRTGFPSSWSAASGPMTPGNPVTIPSSKSKARPIG
jgi:hypothetical protein